VKKFDQYLEKLNFKKLFKVYLIVSILLLIICSSITLFISRDKISMALSYERVTHAFREKGMTDNLKTQLNKFGGSSKDIKNAIVVDKSNKIIYEIGNILVGNNKEFILTPYGSYRNYLQDNINKNVIYKVAKDEDILLNRNYIEKHKEIEDDIDNTFSYEIDLGSSNIYLLNYMVDRDTGNKLFIIRDVSAVPYLEGMLHVIVLIIGSIIALYWVGLALWVYRDANRRNINSALWGMFVLLTNVAGFIVYMIFKQNSIICSTCGVLQNKDNKFCSNCGTMINKTCSKCLNIVNNEDKYCKSCGKEL
jgi:RNA polymerase subunit RPABC4/transcription elongation factor Spt4